MTSAALQRDLDALVPVFGAWERRDRAFACVLRARPDQLVDALVEWVLASRELVDATRVASKVVVSTSACACVSCALDREGVTA